jgi:hypothetical protein
MQEVTKNDQNGAVRNQLTTLEGQGECLVWGSGFVDV